MSSFYYLVSVKHSQSADPYISFWGPNDCGYRWPLSWAGKYGKQTLEAHHDYYNNGHSTFAVPCDVVDPLGIPPTPRTVDNDAGPVVPNTRENWRTLIASAAFPLLEKPKPEKLFPLIKARKEIYNCAGCGRFITNTSRYLGDCNHCGADNRP